MDILNSFEPEALGLIFVLGVTSMIILFVMLLWKLISKFVVMLFWKLISKFVMLFWKLISKKSDKKKLSETEKDCEIFDEDGNPTSSPKSTQSVEYELKEYKLRFDKVDGMWVSFAIIGAHVSKIAVRPNKLLRGAMMDTFVALKVKPTNKAV